MIKHIKKRYYVRHKMLQLLRERQENGHPDYPEDIELNIVKMAEESKIKEELLWNQIDTLVENDEIYNTGDEYNPKFILTSKGNIALQDRKYIRLGRKEFIDEAFDIVKTISAFFAILISIYTLSFAIWQNFKNAERISALEKQVKELKNTSSNYTPNK